MTTTHMGIWVISFLCNSSVSPQWQLNCRFLSVDLCLGLASCTSTSFLPFLVTFRVFSRAAFHPGCGLRPSPTLSFCLFPAPLSLILELTLMPLAPSVLLLIVLAHWSMSCWLVHSGLEAVGCGMPRTQDSGTAPQQVVRKCVRMEAL